MQFNWKFYCNNDANLVDSWLDDDAIRKTGLEDGWQNFYDYWMIENSNESKDCCFLILHENIPFAVMYIGIIGREITISEYIVSPNKRGKGYGSAVLKELLDNATQLLNINVSLATAVIYPNNIASIKAFEKAGFVLISKHPDGDALNYEYIFGIDC